MVTLSKPSAGDTDWTGEINQNWTDIETALNASGWTFIGSVVASNSATVDFTSGITSAYRCYAVVITGARPATDNVFLQARISTDGTTWKSGASDYKTGGDHTSNGGEAIFGGNGQAYLELNRSTAGIGNATGEGFGGIFYLFCPSDTSPYPSFLWQIMLVEAAAGRPARTHAAGQYVAATAVVGLRFLMSSGNIDVGTFKLYGIL